MPRGPEGGLGDAAQNANFVAQVEAQVAQMQAEQTAEASAHFLQGFHPSRRAGG